MVRGLIFGRVVGMGPQSINAAIDEVLSQRKKIIAISGDRA